MTNQDFLGPAKIAEISGVDHQVMSIQVFDIDTIAGAFHHRTKEHAGFMGLLRSALDAGDLFLALQLQSFYTDERIPHKLMHHHGQQNAAIKRSSIVRRGGSRLPPQKGAPAQDHDQRNHSKPETGRKEDAQQENHQQQIYAEMAITQQHHGREATGKRQAGQYGNGGVGIFRSNLAGPHQNCDQNVYKPDPGGQQAGGPGSRIGHDEQVKYAIAEEDQRQSKAGCWNPAQNDVIDSFLNRILVDRVYVVLHKETKGALALYIGKDSAGLSYGCTQEGLICSRKNRHTGLATLFSGTSGWATGPVSIGSTGLGCMAAQRSYQTTNDAFCHNRHARSTSKVISETTKAKLTAAGRTNLIQIANPSKVTTTTAIEVTS